VERRCRVATEPDAEAGRPRGLYGNELARAAVDVVRRATVPIVPPTITNLIAIAAPSGGSGRYRRVELEEILLTVMTGFQAAVIETRRLAGPEATTVVHTGYWGCGAFGGNRVVMSLFQIVAAQSSGVRRLVFHAGAGGGGSVQTAITLLDELAPTSSMATESRLA
jgi:hypothetical protein